MNSSRRDFLRFFAMSAAMAAATGVGLPTLALAADDQKPDKWVKGVCRYCGTGCGVVIETDGVHLLNVRGDPDHPVNRGQLCIKGQTLAAAAVRARLPEPGAADRPAWQSRF